MNNAELPWILFVIALGVIAYMFFSKKDIYGKEILSDNSISETDNKDSSDVQCQFTDVNGKIITITGKSDDPQFQNLCQLNQNQSVYVYGYPYRFIGFNRHHGHGGGHK